MSREIYEVSVLGGDSISLSLDVVGGEIRGAQWNIIGSLALIEAVSKIKDQFKGSRAQLMSPSGVTSSELLLKKLILKVKGEWLTEESDPELCHCRKIPQTHVERAVILGAHTPEMIRQRTSANTGCGTCLPDVEQILEIYLK